MRDRRAEDRDHRVADELLDGAAPALELGAQPLVVRAQERVDVLGVELLGARREADQVGEEDGDDLALPAGLGHGPSLGRSGYVLKVSQAAGSPLSNPSLNHFCRWSEEPCVHDSGSTRPWVFCWIRSSPTDGRGVEALLEVAGLEQLPLRGRVSPDAGEAVRLQLEPDRVLAVLDLVVDPERVLHVVPDLVRDHVGLREVAGSAEAVLQLAEEGEVEVDALVGRAVVRPDAGRRAAAAGASPGVKSRASCAGTPRPAR